MKRILLIWTLVAVAVTGLLDLAGTQELYSPLSSLCCAGKVIHREEEVSLCCGSKVFDPREQLCCSDKVLQLPADPPGVTPPPLIPTGHFRPGGPVYFSARSVQYGCCSDSIYKYQTHICCDGKVLEKPSEESGNATAYPTFYSCCGSEVYDASKQECCRGKLLPKTKVSEGCCGDKIINYEEEICCTEDFTDANEEPVTYRRDQGDVTCCGRQKINLNSELCCNGKVVPVPSNPEDRSRAMCCDDKLWMANISEVCCNGKIMPRNSFDEYCCGSEIINMNTQICCDGVVLPKKSNDTFCCGRKTYDTKHDTCCYGNMTIVSLGNNLEAMACCE